jgi:tRNA (adenine37-N6)-methyltransferase
MYNLKPIGKIYTPYKNIEETPKKPNYNDKLCKVIINNKYKKGLKDLDDFSYIYLICFLDKINEFNLIVYPPQDKQPRGVFSTRSPFRPNPISLTRVKLLRIKDNILFIQGADLLNNTPVIDIKPFTGRIPTNNDNNTIKYGWYKKTKKK